MSSHREAPEISKDPVADNTDLYAFISPDRPDKVTLIANFIPLQSPDGGPNFYEFGDDVVYRINIANRGKAHPDIVYEFRFRTEVRNPETFLYNTGPITSITDTNWNRYVTSARASPELDTWISYRTGSPNSLKFGPPYGSCSGMKLAMSVTVSGRSGLTNAYTSVLSATGSFEISGASRWLDIRPSSRWRRG